MSRTVSAITGILMGCVLTMLIIVSFGVTNPIAGIVIGLTCGAFCTHVAMRIAR